MRVLLEMKRQISWEKQDLNIRSQDLNQLAASQLEFPKKAVRDWMNKKTGNPQLDSYRQSAVYDGPLPEERRIC
jgi:hypothetical protein